MRFVSQEEQDQFRGGRPHQHQQLPMMADEEQNFFITEDVRNDEQDNAIKEENESEDHQPQQNDQDQHQEYPVDQDGQQQEQDDADDDEEFDFGRAKMDFFKKRARDILMGEQDMEYEGNPMPLGGAYKNLKHAIKNPSVVYTKMENKPHYMKMTFSMGRQAPAGGKFLDLSKQSAVNKSVKNLSSNLTDGQLNPLLLSLKQKVQAPGQAGGKPQNQFLDAVFGAPATKTKKATDRDRKVEALLQAYKKQDEELMRKEQEREMTKKMNQKALLDKFGFSDEEDDPAHK